MLVETDREKYAIQRIMDFYQRQPTDYADYFQAAWRYATARARKAGRDPGSTAADAKVSPKYLPMVWQILEDKDAVGPVAKLQKMWRALPAPAANQPDVFARSASRCATSWLKSAPTRPCSLPRRGERPARRLPTFAELEAAPVRLAPPR